MKIALFCSSRNTIPPVETGGTEQPIYYLARGLAEKGHQVTLYVARGSKVPGVKIKEISPFATFLKQKYLNIQERISSFYDLTALSDFFRNEADDFDIIQFNSYIFYEILPFARFSKTPIIIRINYPHHLIYPYIKNQLRQFKNVYYLPISHFIKKAMPGLPYLRPIHPAVDMNDFKFSQKPKDYLLFIGRICPAKGTHLAIEVAKEAEKKLILAGRIDEEMPQNYFNNFIKPHLNKKEIVYLGEVDFKTKIKLYQEAQATLFPIQEPEGFGNIQIESMACGTPVIAFDKGPCREAILNNESGFLIKNNNINQMANAIKRIPELDRQKVRKSAEKKFSLKGYIKKHEDLYFGLIKKNV
jgi:glycosyltransferase involved in cell wall biosynthesis